MYKVTYRLRVACLYIGIVTTKLLTVLALLCCRNWCRLQPSDFTSSRFPSVNHCTTLETRVLKLNISGYTPSSEGVLMKNVPTCFVNRAT